jgi:hypothetical protein
MATRHQRISDFDSEGEPPAGDLMELLCEDSDGTYVLPFPFVGLMARGAAPGPTIRCKPKSLGGEDNEMCRLHAAQAA